jgi:hypothetical protein
LFRFVVDVEIDGIDPQSVNVNGALPVVAVGSALDKWFPLAGSALAIIGVTANIAAIETPNNFFIVYFLIVI